MFVSDVEEAFKQVIESFQSFVEKQSKMFFQHFQFQDDSKLALFAIFR
jgi:hypothetical protein